MLKTIQSGIGTIHDNRRLSNNGFADIVRLRNVVQEGGSTDGADERNEGACG